MIGPLIASIQNLATDDSRYRAPGERRWLLRNGNATRQAEVLFAHADYMDGVVAGLLDEVAALRVECERNANEAAAHRAVIATQAGVNQRIEAERDAMRPVVEAAGHLLTVVEWLDDDSDRTEDWKQAYWDLRVAMEAHDGE